MAEPSGSGALLCCRGCSVTGRRHGLCLDGGRSWGGSLDAKRHLQKNRVTGADEFLLSLLKDVAPESLDIVAFYKAYFDESRLFETKHRFALSGVVFRKGRLARFLSEWRRITGGKFRLVDIVGGKGFYDKSKFSITDRRDILFGAARLVSQYRMVAIACSCNVQDYENVAGTKDFLGFRSPYGVCAHFGLRTLGSWLQKKRIPGGVAYFFESGSETTDARHLMTLVEKSKVLKRAYRHRSDTFLCKKDSRATPLQAGDFVTGIYTRYQERPDRKILGIPIEDLYHALSLGDPGKSVTTHLDLAKLQEFQDRLSYLWHEP